jgi:Holliday junction resolvase-like predicted endonuclease
MAKEDFCFTYYDGDALRDMSHMDRLERGAYNDVVLQQRKFGRMTLDQIKKFLGKDFTTCWPAIELIIKFEDGKYWIEWVENSIIQMRAHAKKQSDKGVKGAEVKAERKRKLSTGKPQLNQSPTATQPLEDGNVNEGEDENADGDELYGKCENFFHGPVPEDLRELATKLKPMPDADQWHDYVEQAVQSLGYETIREVHQDYWHGRKKIKGRIDIVAKMDDVYVAIELDYRQPRLKSIRKVESYNIGMVLLRDPKTVVMPVEIKTEDFKYQYSEQEVEEKLTTALDEIYIDAQRPKWNHINFDFELNTFLEKVRGSPGHYQRHDTGGIRLAFQKQLRDAKSKPHGTGEGNKKQQQANSTADYLSNHYAEKLSKSQTKPNG